MSADPAICQMTRAPQNHKTNAIVDTERLHVVLTIGHPARMLAGFIRLLKAHDVSRVDVRTVPRSRHNPQFNKTSLRELSEVKQASGGA